MRICVVTGIFPPDIGGPASYVVPLTEGLRSAGCEVKVVTYCSGASRRQYSFPVHRISRAIPLPLRLVVTLAEIMAAAAKSDLIYCNGLMLPSVLASIFLQKPMVIKIEGDFAWERASNLRLTSDSIEEFQTRRQNWKAEVLRSVRNCCLRRCGTVITTSKFLAGLIRRWGFFGRLVVISNAVEESFGEEVAELTREECRARISFSGRKVVVSAGRLVPWKGFRGVVLAAEALGPETVVPIIGEGPERRNLAALVEARGLTRKVFLRGKVPRRELAVYLKAADCFVLNSGYESCSHIALEAMKVGTPVVAARTTGTPEMIKHRENGLLFEKDNLSQMVSCLNECLYGNLRDRLTAEAVRRLSRYAWAGIFSRTLDVLEEASRRR